jgi:hypothetical protein
MWWRTWIAVMRASCWRGGEGGDADRAMSRAVSARSTTPLANTGLLLGVYSVFAPARSVSHSRRNRQRRHVPGSLVMGQSSLGLGIARTGSRM